MYFIGLCGSLRAHSSNRLLLDAAKALAPSGCRVEIEDAISQLPHFNPDLEPSDFSVVTDFIGRIRDSAGLIVSSPVYAGGYPGALKNALDWLVGSDGCVEKPFMMLSGSGRVPEAENTLVRVLETMSGKHAADASVVVPILGASLTLDDLLNSPDQSGVIRESLERFAKHALKESVIKEL